MPLLKHDRFIDDVWTEVADDDPLPVTRPIIVSLKRLKGEEAEFLFHGDQPLGVRLDPADKVEALAGWIRRLGLIALTFPVFNDGRAFSQASLLRGRMGFKGELRATGDVLVDQYRFMRRCGFDAFLIREGRPLDSWREAQAEVSLAYQPGAAENAEATILARRHRRPRSDAIAAE